MRCSEFRINGLGIYRLPERKVPSELKSGSGWLSDDDGAALGGVFAVEKARA
jgi:hypothetical protein